MAVGDKIYLADKETLDIVKQKVDNIKYKILETKYYIDENTVLLLHCEDFTDSSQYNKTILNNECTISDDGKFGKSIDFSGTKKLETTEQIIDFNKTFTIDFWCKLRSVNEFSTFIGGISNGSGKINIRDGKVAFELHQTGNINKSTFSPTPNNWFHVALVGNNKNFVFFINGNKNSTFTVQNDITNSILMIGLNVNQDVTLDGLMDEIRISDIVRWNSNFIPPDKPYEKEIIPPIDKNKITLADKPTLDKINTKLDNIQEFSFDGTALENEVVKGKTFYTDGINKHTGTFNIDNLLPENIKEGIKIGDITGNLIPASEVFFRKITKIGEVFFIKGSESNTNNQFTYNYPKSVNGIMLQHQRSGVFLFVILEKNTKPIVYSLEKSDFLQRVITEGDTSGEYIYDNGYRYEYVQPNKVRCLFSDEMFNLKFNYSFDTGKIIFESRTFINGYANNYPFSVYWLSSK